MTWMLWPFAVLLGPMVLLMGLVYLLARFHRRAPKRSPLTRALLRSPDEHLRAQIEELDLDIGGYFAMTMAFPPLLYSLYLVNPSTARSPMLNAGIALTGGVVAVAYAAGKMTQAFLRRRRLRLGYDAEVAVGQELNQLMRDQFWVFHDVPFDGFNIDHVVVGGSGVFAVETKGRTKSIGRDGKTTPKVTFDGKALQFPGRSETGPVEQARRQAESLRTWLSSAVGEPVGVKAVVALPGWFVTSTARSDVAVINPKNSVGFFRKTTFGTLSEQQVTRIVHQLDQKCRDVEPSAYGQPRQKALA